LYEVRGESLFTKEFYMYGHQRLGYLVDERYLGRFCSGRPCLPRDFTSLISDLLPGLGRPSAETLGEEVGPPLPDFPARWGQAWVVGDVAELRLGARRYELSDWLGNVRVVVADRRLPIRGNNQVVVGYRAEVVSVTDYYSFGAEINMRSYEAQPWYRYGYQAQEKDNEIYGKGAMYHYTYRQHDARLGRFWSVDPLARKYPFYSPYAFSGNRLIDRVELEGLEPREKPVETGELQEAPDASTGETRWWVGNEGEWFPSYPPIEIVEQMPMLRRKDVKMGELLFPISQHSETGFFIYEFLFRFVFALGPQKVTYTQGPAVEAMKTSPGVRRAIEEVRPRLERGKVGPGHQESFRYEFTPSRPWDRLLRGEFPFGEEEMKAHKDALTSPVKLFVGSYRGTIRVVDDRTLEVIVYNTTTPNSLFYHIGRYLNDRGMISEEEFNYTPYFLRIHLGDLLYPFPSFRPTEQEYRFLINIGK
jgi:hypothetical protein